MNLLKTRLVFWLQMTLAFFLCIWVGFELSLGMIHIALSTVCVLAAPNSGAVFSKSKWRFVGTIAAGLFFILLANYFIQAPWLFLMGLALWTALCYVVSVYFRYFQAYAAALAGYTVSILMASTFDADSIVSNTIFRVSEVALGIACVAVVFGIGHIRRGIVRLEPQLKAQATRILVMTEGILKTPTTANQISLLRHWVSETSKLQMSLFLLAEEEADYAKQSRSVELALLDIFTPLSQFSESVLALAQATNSPEISKARESVLESLRFLSADTTPDAVQNAINHNIENLQKPLDDVLLQIHDLHQREQVMYILVRLNRLLTALMIYRKARNDVSTYPNRIVGQLVNRQIIFFDAVGVFLGFFLLSWFWVQSQWPYGTDAIIIFSYTLLLQLNTDRPVLSSVSMLWGLLLASLVVMIIKFMLLPLSGEFTWLILCTAVALIPGCWFKVNSKTVAVGSGYLFFFAMLMGFSNEMTYDSVAFINQAVACLIGLFAAIALMAIIHPWRGETRLNALCVGAFHDFEQTLTQLLKGNGSAATLWNDRQFLRVRALDHIVMLHNPEQANHACKRFVQMSELVRRFSHAIKVTRDSIASSHSSDSGHTSEWLDLLNLPSQHNADDLVYAFGLKAGSLATAMAQLNQPEQARNWQSLSDDLKHLNKNMYA